MKNFKATLEEVNAILEDYETAAVLEITELMLWKRLLFGKLYYLESQEVLYKKKYDEYFLIAKQLKQETGKIYTDKMAESHANISVSEYLELHSKNKVIQSTCISIQQDIKVLQQEKLNSKYDGQT